MFIFNDVLFSKLTNSMRKVLLQTITVPQFVKKYPDFCGNTMFIISNAVCGSSWNKSHVLLCLGAG